MSVSARKIKLRHVIYILLSLLLIIIIAQNFENVELRFLSFSFQLPLVVIIITVFLTGFFTSKVFSFKSNSKSSKKDK